MRTVNGGTASGWEIRRDAQLSDNAMEQHARALAVNMRVDGTAQLRICGLSREISKMRQLAGRLMSQQEPTMAMEWLLDNARMVEARAAAVGREKSERLPAHGGVPRLLTLMHELVVHSDARISEERLMRAVRAFDEVQGLKMHELWKIPTALSLELCAAFLSVSRRVVRAAGQRRDADEWVQAILSGKAPDMKSMPREEAFFERALHLLHEQEMPEVRAQLERWLGDRDMDAESLIHAEHERQAVDRLWLSNIMQAFRMLDALDWGEAFQKLSRTENELMRDPAGIYGNLDDESKEVLRKRLCLLAHRADVGEVTVARHVLKLSREGQGLKRHVGWWLSEEQGQRALLTDMGARADGQMPGEIPDENGVAYRAMVALAGALILGALLLFGMPLWGIAPGFMVAWGAGAACVNALVGKFVKPRVLLKLRMDQVPDEWRTLVVMPVLLSSKKRAMELAGEIEAMGAVERDPNIEFLLLGDFADASTRSTPEDQGIYEALSGRIDQMNARVGWTKYHYLNRSRSLVERDGRWMGKERKRGALMALNKLLLIGESEFMEERGKNLAQRFTLVITMDADTRMLPGAARRMIGAMAYPLNAARTDEMGKRRGWAVLQPRMQMPPDAVTNGLIDILGGPGGVDGYHTAVSDVYQDLTGQGIYGGKGIYNLRAFEQAVQGKIDDNTVLSHDLLEGALAGAGYASDLVLYDGHPATWTGYKKRQHRWTRGDWQLLPYLKRSKGLSGLSRYMILDNLRRSLELPAALVMLILGAWLGNKALCVGALLPFLIPLLAALPFSGLRPVKAMLLRMALWPDMAFTQLDAAVRALYRQLISRKKMLEWVTAADSDKAAEAGFGAQQVCALLMLGGLWHVSWISFVAIVAGMFFMAPLVVKALEEPISQGAELTWEQREQFTQLARDTWRFFETYVPEKGCGLPPDNVQMDPPVGAAARTSPTNIGLYLLSCLAANQLGCLDRALMLRRIESTLDSLEKMEKWNGHLYNWYDIRTLEALKPRYVSSVDGGNLAGCLYGCAQGLRALDGQDMRVEGLAQRLDALAGQMDFSLLYNAKRKLFYIGMDVESGRTSESLYDLMASESRILSYVAVMKGDVPAEHFKRLGRAAVRTRDGVALLSWSGTMFEYLMPRLILPAVKGSMMEQTMSAVILTQQRSAPQAGGITMPWGVSESGYFGFDRQMNYQYRAFGLSELALRGDGSDRVVAPYASMLAAPMAPDEVSENLRRMMNLGFSGEFGLYEAVDCAAERLPEDTPYRVVYSYMAHHQGMILCALMNALTEDRLVKWFMSKPEARGLELLLEEGRIHMRPTSNLPIRHAAPQAMRPVQRAARVAKSDAPAPDTHLIYGGGTTLMLSADGRAMASHNGLQLNRFGHHRAMEDGLFIHIAGRGGQVHFRATGQAPVKGVSQRVVFEAGLAKYETQSGDLQARLSVAVSPEDGTVVQYLSLKNLGGISDEVEVTGCFEAALAARADMEAHPAFQKLFVETMRPEPAVLGFKRRAREAGKRFPVMLYAVSGAERGALSVETSREKLLGRNGSMLSGLEKDLSGSVGQTLDPCGALRVRVVMAPEEEIHLGFALGMVEEEEQIASWCRRYCTLEGDIRALQLSETQAKAMLGFLALRPAEHWLFQRAAALAVFEDITDPERRQAVQENRLKLSNLWALGISGDLPLVVVEIGAMEQMPLAKSAMRMHEFWRGMGLWADLVMINDYGNDYDQPVRDALRDMAAASHLRDLGGKNGGLHLLEGSALQTEQRLLLRAASALYLSGKGEEFVPQLRARLQAVEPLERGQWQAMRQAPGEALGELRRAGFNGWGGFLDGGNSYGIDLKPGHPTPAPWCNLLTGGGLGALVSERGGGFVWWKNSRFYRITRFTNDPLWEGFGERVWLEDGERGERIQILPSSQGRVVHTQGMSLFEGGADGIFWRLSLFIGEGQPVKCMALEIENRGGVWREVKLCYQVDWMMGARGAEARLAHEFARDGQCFASSPEGYAAMTTILDLAADAGPNGRLSAALALEPGKTRLISLLMAAGADEAACREALEQWKQGQGAAHQLKRVREAWNARLGRLSLQTPNPDLNALVNRWLPYQTLNGRVWGRSGFYQAGGAFGFRDQLQDMLSLMYLEPDMVRAHLLLAAGHQFESGDVQHWWHPERQGVRTHISDDLLFLPYVTARYVKETGDLTILEEEANYLKDVEIPEGQEDWYGIPELSEQREGLYGHCMRALRRAGSRLGSHGLPLMGTGDWNDGMNRVGNKGKGESVWLAEFLAVTAREFGELARESDKEELFQMANALCEAIETHCWDGDWYIRAFNDEGEKLGSASSQGGCRIDALSQSWAVMAGLNPDRVRRAMDQVYLQLVDERVGIVKLLTPPFDGEGTDPGYIRGYLPGVRENGGQYTHAACWVVMALAKLGQTQRAYRVMDMLLPSRHADSEEKAARYRVEPYVVAADVYGEGVLTGRGGWTWYTGAAAWLNRVAVYELAGLEKRGSRVRLNALLPKEWDQMELRLRWGRSEYHLMAQRDAARAQLDGQSMADGWVELIDDGRQHQAVFPPRPGEG